jgi:hypothetical protein
LYPTRKPNDFDAYRSALRANLKEPGRMDASRTMINASKAAAEMRITRITDPSMVLMGSKDPDF